MSDGYADGGRAGQNLFALFEAAAAAHPDRPFLIVDEKPLPTFYTRLLAEETP